MKKRWETIATTHRTLKDQSHDGTSSKSTMTSKPTATTITTVAETIPTTYTVIIIHRCTSSMSRFFVVNATTSLPYCWGSHVMLIRTTCDCGSFENSWPGPTAAKHRLNFMMEASYILKYNLWIVNSHLDSFHLVSIHNNISKETIQVRSPPLKQSWSPGKSERRRLSSDRSTHLRLTRLKLLGDVM